MQTAASSVRRCRRTLSMPQVPSSTFYSLPFSPFLPRRNAILRCALHNKCHKDKPECLPLQYAVRMENSYGVLVTFLRSGADAPRGIFYIHSRRCRRSQGALGVMHIINYVLKSRLRRRERSYVAREKIHYDAQRDRPGRSFVRSYGIFPNRNHSCAAIAGERTTHFAND